MASKQANWPYVINLGNSIIGVSVLAMPFCFRTCGLLLGTILLLTSAFLTKTSCSLLIKSATTSRKRTYEFLALYTFGPPGKLLVEVSIIGLLLGTCVAFYVIIGDLGPVIVSKVLGVENTPGLRTSLMVFLSLTVALPLGMLRQVESLSNLSAISIGFYTVFIAEMFSAALPNLWSGVWVAKVEYWNPEGVFRCLPIFSLAFSCQTTLFVMYDALPEPSLKRMSYIIKGAITMCATAYITVGFFGYVAFCDDEISGDVLLNFRPTIFSEAIKFGFVLSVAMSFPLVIFPCRASIYTLLFAKETGKPETFSGSTTIPVFYSRAITMCIVLGTLVVGILVPNIEFILAITGATMGSMICYIFPAVMFIHIMSMTKTSSKSTAQLVLFLGVTILLASTYVTLNAQDRVLAEKGDSVVKIAPPGQENENEGILEKDEVKGVAPDGDPDKLEKDGDDVIKDAHDTGQGEGEIKDKDGKKDEEEVQEDKRQEPPNPHAPLDDDDEQEEPVLIDKEKEKEGGIEAEEEVEKQKEDRKKKRADKQPEDEKEEESQHVVKQEEQQQEKEKEAAKEDEKKEEAKEEKKKTAEEKAEAKALLAELKDQQKEQKKLIEEQKQIIEDLKQHQKEAHAEKTQDKGNSAQQAAAPEQKAGIDQPVQQLQDQQQPVQQLQDQQQPVQQLQDQQQPVQQLQDQQQPVQQLQDQQQPVQQLQDQQQPVQPLQDQQQPVQQLQDQQQPVQQLQDQQQPVQPLQDQQQPVQQLPDQQQPVQQLQDQQQPVQQLQDQQQPVQQLQDQQQPVQQLQDQQQPVQQPQDQQQPVQQQPQDPKQAASQKGDPNVGILQDIMVRQDSAQAHKMQDQGQIIQQMVDQDQGNTAKKASKTGQRVGVDGLGQEQQKLPAQNKPVVPPVPQAAVDVPAEKLDHQKSEKGHVAADSRQKLKSLEKGNKSRRL